MSKYRQKPVEAFRMTKKRRRDNSDWPEWANEAWNRPCNAVGAISPTIPGSNGCGTVSIRKPHCTYTVTFGDWIIKDSGGFLTSLAPDIFHATYDAVDDDGETVELCEGCRSRDIYGRDIEGVPLCKGCWDACETTEVEL